MNVYFRRGGVMLFPIAFHRALMGAPIKAPCGVTNGL
jgi:hypothetical protein